MIDKVMLQRKMRRDVREALDYITEKAQIVTFNPILLELDLAAVLMEAAAKGNKRVKKPFYHFALAWSNADAPTEEQMQEVARGALRRLGLLEHQWVAAVHDDAGHPHIHILVNLVHPDTYRCASTSYDFFKLGQYATEMERQYGWMELRRYGAPGQQIQIGTLQLYERDLLPRSRGNGRPLTPTEAAFQKWLQDEILEPLSGAIGRGDASWKDTLATIGRYGIRYVPSGGGACFVDAVDSSISIAASSVARIAALPRLEKYLGAFEDITVPVDVTRAFSRSAAALGLSVSEPYRKLVSRYRFEKHVHREQTRVMRRDAWAAQRAKEVAQRGRIREECRNRLRGTRVEPKDVRLKVRPQIFAAKDRALEELERQHNFERDRLRDELRRGAKPEPWHIFLHRLVCHGDRTAIAYTQSTKRLADAYQPINLFGEAASEMARPVARNASEDEKMPPLIAAYEQVPRNVKQIAVAPSEKKDKVVHLPAEIRMSAAQEDLETIRKRLMHVAKPRPPKLAL